ncbi:hypothetical protein F5Y08DRAFT_310061 [Xylaria arbuscula]|nr:hypothetical protein F5Y08DRAFT_310061 [Xylaria arbuscula]
MKGEKTASSNKNPTSIEDERARLRRNQRNSRARKQAYVQDLEKRWNECLRLGAQATVEMQRESRKVHDENRLLRCLLHNQGLDDAAIGTAIVNLLDQESEKPPSILNRPIPHEIQTSDGGLSHWNSETDAVPSAVLFTGGEMPLGPQGDTYQELHMDDWLSDLCNIKDAFASDALV